MDLEVEVEAMEKSNECVITIHDEQGIYGGDEGVESIEEGEIEVENDIGLGEVLDSPLPSGGDKAAEAVAVAADKGFGEEKSSKAAKASSTTQRDILLPDGGNGSTSSKNAGKAYRKRSEAMESKRKESDHRGDKSAKSFKSDENGNKERGFHLSDVFKGSESLSKGFQAADRLHSLKVPQAVVAFAQAAAKVNEIPGWPLLPKPQMKKCEKCSREFYSMLNYRRHIRLHRRSLIDDRDLRHERSQLAAFWDKLAADEACDIISFNNMGIENLSGTSAFQALASFVQQPGMQTYPPAYMKAGTVLLEIVQSKSSLFPLPSEKLFKVLDDASEATFLCGGTSVAVQRFVYHNEIGLDSKNAVASMSFLVEQKLLKAWIAEKGVEALRCEKALVEEEEAAQRKRAKELERKRQRKNKQKGRKGIDQPPGDEDANAPSAGDEEEYPASSTSFGVHDLETAAVTEVTDENGFLLLLRDNQSAPIEASDPSIENSISDEKMANDDDDQTRADETGSRIDTFVDQRIGRAIKDRRRSNFSSSATFRSGDSSYQAYFRPRRMQHSTRVEPYQQHYRKKLGGVYRGIVKGSNGRVVWTRKASQPVRANDDEQELNLNGSVESVESVETETETLMVGSLTVPLEGHHVRRHSNASEENSLMSKSSTPESSWSTKSTQTTTTVKVWKPVGKLGDGDNARSSAEDIVESEGSFPPKLAAVSLRPIDNADDNADAEPYRATSPSPSSKLLASFLSERWATAVDGKRSKNTKVWPVNGDQSLDVVDEANGVLNRNFGSTACGKAVGRWHRNPKDKQSEQRYMPRQLSMA